MRRGPHSNRTVVTDIREQGFSLVLVLLVIAALSLGAALFLQTVRGYGRTVSSASTAVMLEAQADAGFSLRSSTIRLRAQRATSATHSRRWQ